MTGSIISQSILSPGALNGGGVNVANGRGLQGLSAVVSPRSSNGLVPREAAVFSGLNRRGPMGQLQQSQARHFGQSVPSLRNAASNALTNGGGLKKAMATGFANGQSRSVPTANLGGGLRQQLGALGAIFSKVSRPQSALLFVTAAGALVGGLAWAKQARSHSKSSLDTEQTAIAPPGQSDNNVPDSVSIAPSGKLANLAGDWIIRQHREYNAFTPPAINNHVCSTRYSAANIKVSGDQATMTEQLQLVEQGSKGLIKSRLAEPIEAQSYPTTQVLSLKMKDEDMAQVTSSPFEETLGFEKSSAETGPAKFPKVRDRSKEQIDPVSNKGLGFLADVDVSFMMVHVTGRVRTMQIMRGALEGELVDGNTMRGDLDLDFDQAVSFSDNARVRNATPKTRYMNENSDWVAVRRPADWGDDWADGLSREAQLEALHKLFEDQPLKPGAEERGQRGWAGAPD